LQKRAVDVGEAISGLMELSKFIAQGGIGAAASIFFIFIVILPWTVSLYFYRELRKAEQGRVTDLRLSLEKAERENAAHAAAIEVIRSFDTKIRRLPR
jgi:hypothetical protein